MATTSGQGRRPSFLRRITPAGIATTLYHWLVADTAGDVKPSTDIWNGSKRTAPEMPAGEVTTEMQNATSGGSHTGASMPATGKCTKASYIIASC